MKRILLLVAALASLATRALAQFDPEAGRHTSPRQALTIQPVQFLLGFYSAEYERAVSTATTVGVGANYFEGFFGSSDAGDDPKYFSTELKVRYYPGERPLQGFSFGVSGGYVNVQPWDLFCFDSCNRTHRTGASAGFLLDYGWLLGRNERFAVALGAGAKRLFVHTSEGDRVRTGYPTLRISAGLAF